MDLINNEPVLRLACFAGVFGVMALWEIMAPRRRLGIAKSTRWLSNLGLVALNALVVRLLLPLGAASVALLAHEHGWGLFNNLALPAWLVVVISIIALDIVIYLQHVLFHAVPALWHLHMVHHTDLDFDVTTGVRFHTLEILLSLGIKLAVVVLLGAPALAVLLFEVLLNATSLFNHSNVRIPERFDGVLRWVVVTPDMHRVHHSILLRETNSNFGFNLPWWDRLFGTYRPQPAAGQESMTIGIEQFRDPRELGLDRMLLQPFRGDAGRYPAGERQVEQ